MPMMLPINANTAAPNLTWLKVIVDWAISGVLVSIIMDAPLIILVPSVRMATINNPTMPRLI